MASDEHHKLAQYIKSVHHNLRRQARENSPEEAWRVHCSQRDMLDKYATSMKQLATKYWEPNAQDENSKARSRIQWVVEQCTEYFFKGGVLAERKKEERKWLSYHQSNSLQESGFSKEAGSDECDTVPVTLHLLDVGSCFNPFKTFPFFSVVPIDLAPASSDVYQCDFLNLKVRLVTSDESHQEIEGTVITQLSESTFDMVVFSLLLEYMPSPKQRYKSCSKAYQLLKPEGLLFIVTPDSKHPSANASLMKRWRIALANIGFVRIYYDKLPHIHCMAFRKSRHPELARRQSDYLTLSSKSSIALCPEELISIPQDFQDIDSVLIATLPYVDRTVEDNQLVTSLFNELPCVTFVL